MVTKHSLKECLSVWDMTKIVSYNKKTKNSSYLVLFLYQVCQNYRLEPFLVEIFMRDHHIQTSFCRDIHMKNTKI